MFSRLGNSFTYGVTGETECDFENTLPTLIVLYIFIYSSAGYKSCLPADESRKVWKMH